MTGREVSRLVPGELNTFPYFQPRQATDLYTALCTPLASVNEASTGTAPRRYDLHTPERIFTAVRSVCNGGFLC